MNDRELIEFNSKCLKLFGYPASFIKYKIEELDSRIKNIEVSMERLLPVMAATSIRSEAVIHALDGNNIIKKNLIDLSVETISGHLDKSNSNE